MWHEILVGNKFISTLYFEVPQLKNVRIHEIKIRDEGRKATIRFDMPSYADNPPEKWKRLGYNTVHVELDFFDIQEITLKSVKSMYVGDINLTNQENGLIVSITGSLEFLIKVDTGVIQTVSAYTNG